MAQHMLAHLQALSEALVVLQRSSRRGAFVHILHGRPHRHAAFGLIELTGRWRWVAAVAVAAVVAAAHNSCAKQLSLGVSKDCLWKINQCWHWTDARALKEAMASRLNGRVELFTAIVINAKQNEAPNNRQMQRIAQEHCRRYA